MSIKVSISIDDLLLDRHREAIDSGAFDGEQVWVRYMTQEDGAVRPSHAALHGTLWKADDIQAPAPPLDYGCRCWLEYVAKPNTLASHVFRPADGSPEDGAAGPFGRWLDDAVPDWRGIAKRAMKEDPAERLARIHYILTSKHPSTYMPRDVARMIGEAYKAE